MGTLSNILIPPPSLYYPHTSSPRYPRPSTRSPPPVTAWGLKASAAISPNMTQVVVTSCQNWLCPYETGFSGPATLSMTLPSGFKPSPVALDNLKQRKMGQQSHEAIVKQRLGEEQREAKDMEEVESGTRPDIASYILREDSLELQFLYLTPEEVCITLPLVRKEIVGNLLPEMEVTIRSDTSPEHFASQSLKLDELSRPTCALCASHSCPKCSSTKPSPSSSSTTSISFTSTRFFSTPILLLLLLRL